MGCGKSSVGRRLSELLGWRFMDLDEVIEAREGRRIPEIFAEDGEAEFRAMELEALKMIINDYGSESQDDGDIDGQDDGCGRRNGNLVLALGGGAVMTPECAALIQEYTLCIYLRASVDTLVNRLVNESAGRPVLQSSGCSKSSGEQNALGQSALRTRITELMSFRSSTYEAVAHQIIDTDGFTINEAASYCMKILNPRANRQNR